jgi:TonB family protein
VTHSDRVVNAAAAALAALATVGLLAAQDTKPLPPPPSLRQVIQDDTLADPASANAQSVPARDSGTGDHEPVESVLCNPPGKPTTRVEAEIMNAAENVQLRQYLDANVLPLVRANWYRLVFKSGEKAGGQARIQFTVLKDGTIAAPRLTDGAGHAALGDLAVKALSNSAPFPALPSDFAGPSVDLRTDFTYEPPARSSTNAVASSHPFPPTYSHICSVDETAKGSVDCLTPPKPVYKPEPVFTEEARRKKAQGTVVLFARVAQDGTVKSVCASQPLDGGLDATAVETVRTWKFEPAIINGKPSDALIEVEVDFRLSDGPPAALPAKYEPAMGPPATGGPNDHPPSATIRVLSHATGSAVTGAASSESSAPQCNGQTGGCTMPPRLILSPGPEPMIADTKAKYSGTATLSLTISVEGKPENIKVVKSLGPELDQKAIAAVEKWKFEPAMQDGKPVPVEIMVDVDFHLH